MAAKHHANLKVVEEFLRRKIYPKEIAGFCSFSGRNLSGRMYCHRLLENNFFQFKTLVQNRAKIFCCNIIAMCKKVE